MSTDGLIDHSHRRMVYRDEWATRTFVYCPRHAPSPADLRASVRYPFTIVSDAPVDAACTICACKLDEILRETGPQFDDIDDDNADVTE